MTDSIGPDPVAGGAVGDDADDAPDRTVLDREERAARQLIMTLGSKPEPTALSEDEAAREGTAHGVHMHVEIARGFAQKWGV